MQKKFVSESNFLNTQSVLSQVSLFICGINVHCCQALIIEHETRVYMHGQMETDWCLKIGNKLILSK